VAIDIEIFGQLLPGQPRRRAMEIEKPETVRSLAQAIGLDPEDIGLVTINGVQSGLDEPVNPDSRVCFFPYITGG
jgi:molybdopterin converting factor small subunit